MIWYCRERPGHPSSGGSEGDGLHQPDHTDRHGPVEEAPQTWWDWFILTKEITLYSLLKIQQHIEVWSSDEVPLYDLLVIKSAPCFHIWYAYLIKKKKKKNMHLEI